MTTLGTILAARQAAAELADGYTEKMIDAVNAYEAEKDLYQRIIRECEAGGLTPRMAKLKAEGTQEMQACKSRTVHWAAEATMYGVAASAMRLEAEGLGEAARNV